MLQGIVQFIEQSGAWMYVLAPAFMVVVAILPVPAEIPAMLNGMVFGAFVGTLVSWSGAMVGAVISFELAARYGRPLAARFLAPKALARTDRVALSAGWPGWLVARLVPIVAFTALNWSAGLTALPRWTFLWTTAVGIIPGAILFTSTGTGLAAFYAKHPRLASALIAGVGGAIAFTYFRYRRAATMSQE